MAYTESAEVATSTLGGIATLALGRWVQDEYAPPVWQASRLDGGALQRVDPGAPPDLHNAQAVWFDPGLGWVTERANIVVKQDFFDQAFPVLVGIGAAWATAGLAAGAGGAVGSATGSAVLGAAAQAGVAALAVSTATQIVINGRIDFGQLVRSTLGGAITGGLMQATGVADALKSAAFATRALAVTGQATVQGSVQELLGGHFKDGFTAGLASGLAGEITTALDAAIGSMQGLSAAESSALRLLARATGSAVRAAANPGDPAQAFGLELLGTLVQDNLPPPPLLVGAEAPDRAAEAAANCDLIALPSSQGLSLSPEAAARFEADVQAGIERDDVPGAQHRQQQAHAAAVRRRDRATLPAGVCARDGAC